MLKWLKGKAEAAAQKQCILNVRLNTKTLVAVANRVDQKMLNSGGDYSQSDTMEVMKAGQALLTDIRLGLMNGLSLEAIENEVIRPALSEEQVGSFASSVVEDAISAMRREVESQSG